MTRGGVTSVVKGYDSRPKSHVLSDSRKDGTFIFKRDFMTMSEVEAVAKEEVEYQKRMEIFRNIVEFQENINNKPNTQTEDAISAAIYRGYQLALSRLPDKDRRRRVFEQVAIAYTTKHWPDYQEQPSDQTLMGWAEHTSEIILSSANKFAEKEIK